MNGLTWRVLNTLKVNVILPTTRMTMILCTLPLPWMTSNATHKHGSLEYTMLIFLFTPLICNLISCYSSVRRGQCTDERLYLGTC